MLRLENYIPLKRGFSYSGLNLLAHMNVCVFEIQKKSDLLRSNNIKTALKGKEIN